MATTTTKLALIKPTTSEAVDIAILNLNTDKIDASVGATPCTSATRPATPYNGQYIFETDTSKIYVYNSTSSSWVSPVVDTANNALKLNGRNVYVQSGTPTGMATGDLWFWGS